MRKKLLNTKLWLITMMLALFSSGNLWADETASVSISTYATANSWSNSTAYTTVTLNSYISASGKTGGNNNKYYSSNNSWRHYEGDSGAITITASGGTTLKSVTFTYTNGNNGVLKYSGSNYTSGTACTAVNGQTSATFTVGRSSGTKNGNVQITAISVTYTAAAAKYTLTKSATNGTISTKVGGSEVTSAAEDATVTITATPSDGYAFGSWSVTKTSGGASVSVTSATSNPTTFTMPDEAVTVSASFTQNEYSVDFSGVTNGSVTSVKVNDVDKSLTAGVLSGVHYGDVVKATASAAENYVYDSWTVIDDEAENVDFTGNETITFTMPASDVTAEPTFAATYAIATSASNGTIATSVGGNAATRAKSGATVTITATPSSGYVFSSWSVTKTTGGETVSVTSSTTNPTTFTMPGEGVTVTATFTSALAITKSATNGTISTKVGGSEVTAALEDETVTITATPSSGYAFGSWSVTTTSGGESISVASATSNPTTFTMPDEAVTVSATFNQLYDISLSNNGSVTGGTFSADVSSAVAGAKVTLTATPATGYEFDEWTVTDENEGTVTVTSNQFTMPAKAVTVSATFKKTKHSITLAAENGAATIKVGNADAKDMEDGDEETDIEYGTSVTMTAIADDGYIFSGWEVEGVDITDEQAATSPLTFTLPDDDVTVTANYAVKHTVTYYIAGEENVTYRAHGATLSLEDPDDQSGKPFYKWSSTNTPANPTWVENTATVTSNMTLYAMFTKKDAEYKLVEADQADWVGDYLIAYSEEIFADGRKGGTDTGCIGKASVSANPGTKLSGKIVDVEWGDTYKVSIEYYGQVNSKRAYLLKTQDGQYNYYTTNANNGLSVTENRATAGAYAFNVTFTSSSDVKLCLTGDATGSVFRYNSGSSLFRFYKNGGQSAVYLYKRSSAEYTNAEPVYYDITVDDDTDNGEIEASATSALEKTTITLTATPDANYGLKTWTVTDEDDDAVEMTTTGANTATFEMPAKNVSVTATFERLYSATFHSKGATYSTANYFNGDDVEFPTNPASVGNMKFMGWSETDITASQAGEPTYVSEKTMGTANLNFYAVYRYVKTIDLGTDELTLTSTGVENGASTYTSWSGFSDNSDAVYAGENAGGNNSIQIRSKSNAGIVTTTSGGYARKVTIDWNSNTTSARYVTIYGKNTAYSGSADLYDNSKMGTLLGTIVKGTSTELTITGNYQYIGIKASDPIYINTITIKWEDEEVGNYGTEFVETTVNSNSADNSSSPKYYTTLYTDKKFIVPDDNMVATVDGVNGSKLQFNYYTKGQIVPANTGVVIVQTETGNFVCNYSNGEATTHSNNKLHGSLVPNTTTNVGGVTTGYKFYKMSRNADGDAYSVGFYWGADEGAAFTMKTAGKCWLALPDNSDIRGFAFGEDVVSGVEGFDAYLSTDSNKYYDLQGRRVLQPQKGQLYIVNGKKVLY